MKRKTKSKKSPNRKTTQESPLRLFGFNAELKLFAAEVLRKHPQMTNDEIMLAWDAKQRGWTVNVINGHIKWVDMF
jgi:hypothetical protein